MTTRERQGWIIVASMFVTLLLVFGAGYNTTGVFLTPLMKEFGWARAKASSLQSLVALSAGLCTPFAGVLLDRIEARRIMMAGALVTALAFVLASRATSYPMMVAAYLTIGVGLTGATLLPAALVIANWFGAKRGIAMGVAFAGTSFGGAVMTLVASKAMSIYGWRAAYLTLAVPMVVVVIPLVLLVIRTRPDDATTQNRTVSQRADALPGFEVAEALRTRSFWMICAAQFFYALVAAGAGLHLIPYLIGLGYKATFAAGIMSIVFLFTTLGKITMGFFSDRISARVALMINFVGAGLAMVMIFGAANPVMLAPFVAIFGFTLGAPLVLVPLLTADALGLKRFGSIGGIAGVFNTAGAFVGPIALGRIFDVTGSYRGAFEICLLMCGFGLVASFSCLTYDTEQARAQGRRVASAAA